VQPQWQWAHGYSSAEDFVETAGSGTPIEQIATARHAIEAIRFCPEPKVHPTTTRSGPVQVAISHPIYAAAVALRSK
jgi:hypothetical protein